MSESKDTITAPCGCEMPAPTKEHAWLKQFNGHWEAESELTMDPAQPPMKATGQDVGENLGDFWIVNRMESSSESMPAYHSQLTLGYDVEKAKYVGSYIDSMSGYMWLYEGTVDASGRILTLDTRGPNPMSGGVGHYKEVTEFKSATHRVFTSSLVQEDGSLLPIVEIHFRKK